MKYLVEALSGPLGKHKKLMRVPLVDYQKNNFKRLGTDQYNNHRLVCAVSCLLADIKNESALSFLGMLPGHGISNQYSRLSTIPSSYDLNPWQVMRDNLNAILNLHGNFISNHLLSSYIDKLFALFSVDGHLHPNLPHGVLHVLSFLHPQAIKGCVYISEPMGKVHSLQQLDVDGCYLKQIILYNNSIHTSNDFSEDVINRQFRIDVARFSQHFDITRHYLPADKKHFDGIKQAIKKLALDLTNDLKRIDVLRMKQLLLPIKVLLIDLFSHQGGLFHVLINDCYLTISVNQEGQRSIVNKPINKDLHEYLLRNTHLLFKPLSIKTQGDYRQCLDHCVPLIL